MKSNLYEDHSPLVDTFDFNRKDDAETISLEASQKWIDEPFFNSGSVVPKATFTAVPLSMSMNEQNFRIA